MPVCLACARVWVRVRVRRCLCVCGDACVFVLCPRMGAHAWVHVRGCVCVWLVSARVGARACAEMPVCLSCARAWVGVGVFEATAAPVRGEVAIDRTTTSVLQLLTHSTYA